MKKQERVTFQIKTELRKQLETSAIKDGRTLSNLIHRILDEWAKEHGHDAKEVQQKKGNGRRKKENI